MRRRTDAADRFAERRRQEDEAPRLRDVVPNLVSCRIEIGQRRETSPSAEVSHTRHLVVERAPAMCFIPCSDASCRDGGHDISTYLLRCLRDGQQSFRGDDTCQGDIGSARCGRILEYTAIARYGVAP